MAHGLERETGMVKIMKLRLGKPLPRLFSTHPQAKGIIHEARVKLSGYSRLQAKVLVFDTNKSMRHFFDKVLDRPGQVCPKTQGICTALTSEVIKFHKDGSETHLLEVDPRYFCLIGLIYDHVTPEVVAHECIHAGFAYAARQRRKIWDGRDDAMPEEEVCYPSGKMISMLFDHLTQEGIMRHSFNG